MPITFEIVKTLEEGGKGGYKSHEIEGTNNFFRNVTTEFAENAQQPVDLENYFVKSQGGKPAQYMWALAATSVMVHAETGEMAEGPIAEGETDNYKPAMLISLIVGKEHEFNEAIVKQKNEGSDISIDHGADEPGDDNINITEKVEEAPAPKNLGAEEQEEGSQAKKKGKEKAVQEKKKTMGHGSLTHTALLAGDIVETTDGWLMNNKSGRFGQGNEEARKRHRVSKIELLEFAAGKLQVESNLNIVALDLYHSKTPLMHVMYRLEKFAKDHPLVDNLTAHKLKKIPQSSTRLDPPLHPGIAESMKELKEGTQAEFEAKHGSNIKTENNPANVVNGSLGFLVGQGDNGDLYLQTAKQQVVRTFTKVPAAVISGQQEGAEASAAAVTAAGPLPPPQQQVALRPGQPLSKEFKDLVKSNHPTLFAEAHADSKKGPGHGGHGQH